MPKPRGASWGACRRRRRCGKPRALVLDFDDDAVALDADADLEAAAGSWPCSAAFASASPTAVSISARSPSGKAEGGKCVNQRAARKCRRPARVREPSPKIASHPRYIPLYHERRRATPIPCLKEPAG